MDLLIDSGNSRIKWAYSQGGQLRAHGSAARGAGIPDAAQAAWQAGPCPTRVMVANVAGHRFAVQLDQWLQARWQLVAECIQVNPDQGGIHLAYAQPERLGVDRWLAMVAAVHDTTGPVAVIDAGTALTLDVVTHDGWHEGGIIVPGIELMAEALLRKSSGIQFGTQGDTAATTTGPLGTDTHSAIEKGSLYAVTGAIEHALARRGATAQSGLSVIICGGHAALVMAELNLQCRPVPDLVLRGMQIIKGGG